MAVMTGGAMAAKTGGGGGGGASRYNSKQLGWGGTTLDQYDLGSYWNNGPGSDLLKQGNPMSAAAGRYGNLYGEASGAGSIYGTSKAPDWDDPAVKAKLNSYRQMMQGAQMGTAADLVRDTANLGVRGNMGSVGSRPANADMMKDQISGIARQSSEMYGSGLDRLTDNNRWNYNIGRDQLNDRRGILDSQLAAERAAADYDMQIANMRRDDWQKQLELNRQQQADNLARRRQVAEDERLSLERGNKAMDEWRYENLINNWSLERAKMGSMTDPRAVQEMLAVKTGQYEPLKRSMTVNANYNTSSPNLK